MEVPSSIHQGRRQRSIPGAAFVPAMRGFRDHGDQPAPVRSEADFRRLLGGANGEAAFYGYDPSVARGIRSASGHG
jgi:hypothetical protein